VFRFTLPRDEAPPAIDGEETQAGPA